MNDRESANELEASCAEYDQCFERAVQFARDANLVEQAEAVSIANALFIGHALRAIAGRQEKAKMSDALDDAPNARAFDKMAFGKRVAEIRDACGLRQIDLAERAGISVTFISEVENGKRDISASTLARMAWVLGDVSLDYLALGRAIRAMRGAT